MIIIKTLKSTKAAIYNSFYDGLDDLLISTEIFNLPHKINNNLDNYELVSRQNRRLVKWHVLNEHLLLAELLAAQT